MPEDQVERRNLTDVLLVGHSLGGFKITGAARRLRDRVSPVVDVSAFVPSRVASMNDGPPAPAAEYSWAGIATSPDGTISLPFELLRVGPLQPPSAPPDRVQDGEPWWQRTARRHGLPEL